MQRRPAASAEIDADLGVLEHEHVARGELRREQPVRREVAVGRGLAARDVLGGDDQRRSSRRCPAAASVASISLRAAPEQIATGTCSAARRTASRTCGGIVEPSAVRAR